MGTWQVDPFVNDLTCMQDARVNLLHKRILPAHPAGCHFREDDGKRAIEREVSRYKVVRLHLRGHTRADQTGMAMATPRVKLRPGGSPSILLLLTSCLIVGCWALPLEPPVGTPSEIPVEVQMPSDQVNHN